MKKSQEQAIRIIHQSPWKMVLAITGGGSQAVSTLLSVPGGSNSVLEAIIPYANVSVNQFLHYKPEQYCSEYMARLLAMAAFHRALTLDNNDIEHRLGIGVTASLVSDRPKKGDHRIHIAIQSNRCTASFSLILSKEKRNRQKEELLAAELVLNSILFTINALNSNCVKPKHLDYFEQNDIEWTYPLSNPLLPEEILNVKSCFASPEWSSLFFSEEESVCAIYLDRRKTTIFQTSEADTNVIRSPDSIIFPGSFRPIHEGHVKMTAVAEKLLERPVELEISVRNVDKPPLDFLEAVTRLHLIRQAIPQQAVWFTRFPLFVDKSAFFKNKMFMMGTDTLIRLGNPVYHGGSAETHQNVIQKIIDQGAHFLLFVRKNEGIIEHLNTLPVCPELKTLCQEVPIETFLEDISSTELRYRNR